MDLTQLANLGEFIGGVAVLVTLIYLAGQVRISNLREQAQTHRALVDQWNAAFVEPLRDPSVSPLLRRAFRDFESLSGDDQTIAGIYFAGGMNVGQEANFLRATPAIDIETATTWENAVAAILQVPGPRQWWSTSGHGWSQSFQARMVEVLASESAPPPMTVWMPWLADDPES